MGDILGGSPFGKQSPFSFSVNHLARVRGLTGRVMARGLVNDRKNITPIGGDQAQIGKGRKKGANFQIVGFAGAHQRGEAIGGNGIDLRMGEKELNP